MIFSNPGCGATVSADQLQLYSATGRACRRKWRYIKYTPLPFTFTVNCYDTLHGECRLKRTEYARILGIIYHTFY